MSAYITEVSISRARGEPVAKEWVVATDYRWLEGLGEYLARAVSGEWREVVAPAVVGYVRPAEEAEGDALRIARAVSRFLLEARLPIFVTRRLHRRYRDFSEGAEGDGIVRRACRILTADPDRNRDRIDLATAEVLSFLADHDVLILDGVAAFLWPEIVQELEDAIDQAVDEYLIEREYREFVALLRRLVTMAKESAGAVHVFHTESRFYVEDERGDRLGEDLWHDMVAGLQVDEGTAGDLLVSLLVTLAPNRLTIHRHPPDDEAMRTLDAVFGSAVRLCGGCRRCQDASLRVDNPGSAK